MDSYDLNSIHDFIFNSIMPKLDNSEKKNMQERYFNKYYTGLDYNNNLISFFLYIYNNKMYKFRNLTSEIKENISLLYYSKGMHYYNKDKYETAIAEFDKCLSSEFCDRYGSIYENTNERIAICKYYLGKEKYDNSNYDKAKSYLESSIKYLSESSNRFCYEYCIKSLMAAIYEHFGSKEWKCSNRDCMENSIYYYKKACTYDSDGQYDDILNRLYEYFNLYKAYHAGNIESQKDYLYSSYNSNGDYYNDIKKLYDLSCQIESMYNEVRNSIEILRNQIRDIDNNLSNQKAINSNKRTLIKTKEEKILTLQNEMITLTKDLESITEDTKKCTEDVINIQKDLSEDKNNLNQDEMIEDLKAIEDEKEKEIKERKENNKKLAEQNEQYIIMIETLEKSLKARLH
jgi:hypothetical protein